MIETTDFTRQLPGEHTGMAQDKKILPRERMLSACGEAQFTHGQTQALQNKFAIAAYIALSVAALSAAAFGAWSLPLNAAVHDVFSGAASLYETILCTAKLLLPILCEFLAVFVFAFSPLCATACLASLAARGIRVGIAIRALAAGSETPLLHCAAIAVYAGGALALALFCALAFALSPRLRTVGFSSFDGRREALFHTVWFFTLSGAAALLTAAAALILHL